MKRIGIGTLHRLARKARNRVRPRALILVYHRVAALSSDPWGLAVSPTNFAEHLDVLRRYANPVPLEALWTADCQSKRTHRTISVTFDDGYVDVLTIRQVFEQFGVPATLFIPTGMLDSCREFWWDELDRVLLQPGRLPRTIRFNVASEERSWHLGDSASYGFADAERHRSWRAWDAPPTPRHAAYQSLYWLLQTASEDDRQRTIHDLYVQAGMEQRERSSHRVLTWSELRELARDPHIEVGAHTVSHPTLASLHLESQRLEIGQSKARLEKAVGRTVTAFAYPFGRPADLSPETVDEVRRAGFRIACLNTNGTVTSSTDPLRLPRLFVRDFDGQQFRRWIAYWFDA